MLSRSIGKAWVSNTIAAEILDTNCTSRVWREFLCEETAGNQVWAAPCKKGNSTLVNSKRMACHAKRLLSSSDYNKAANEAMMH